MDLCDVRVVQRRKQLGFAMEPRHTIDVVDTGRPHHFDCDVTVEPAVSSAIHLAHAARAEDGHDLVGTDASAFSERHV